MLPSRKFAVLQLLFGVIVLCAGLAAFAALASLRTPPARRELAERIYNVEVFTVQPASLREIVVGYGTAKAEHEVQYSAQVAGEITVVSERLKVGERVAGPAFQLDLSHPESRSRRLEGDLLLAIDPQVYHERLTQSETAIAEAEAERRKLMVESTTSDRLLNKAQRDYELSKAEYNRLRKLAADGGVSDSQLQQQQLELQKYEEAVLRFQNDHDLLPVRREQLDTKIERLKADRKLSLLDVERTQVRPPFTGTLSAVMVEKGQFVQPGAPLFRLVNTDVVEIAVPLQATDFAKVAELVLQGRQPRVRLAENESAADRWEGQVVRIAPEADPQTRTLDVFVRVENRPGQVPLLPGTFVQARIEGPVLSNAIVIPREALPGAGLRGRVFVVKDGQQVQAQEVGILHRLEGLAFVTGLVAGQQVVLTNLDVLQDGSRVTSQAAQTLDSELAKSSRLQMADETQQQQQQR